MIFRTNNAKGIWIHAKRSYPPPAAVLALLLGLASYCSAVLGADFLSLQGISILWPGNALLVSVLLLVPRKDWPILILACFTGFFLHDLKSHLAPPTIAVFMLSNTIEVLTVAVGLEYCFEGLPQLNSSKALVRFSVVGLHGALFGSVVGAFASSGTYWATWRVFFLGNLVALLTLTQVFLSLLSSGLGSILRSSKLRVEAAALAGALILESYVIFGIQWNTFSPTLIYGLVLVFLWAALRFGPVGVSASTVTVAVFSTWGCIHGLGPFNGPDLLHDVLSMQLFLLFAAVPFIWLAVVVEEREEARILQRDLAGRLMSAQEEERRRIARELHDDINQQVAVLAIDLQRLKRFFPDESSIGNRSIDALWERTHTLSRNIQHLSHQLHSTKLEHLGIVAGLRGLCHEFSEQNKIEADFQFRNVTQEIDSDVALTLFRIAQESLQNVGKHSHARTVRIELDGEEHTLLLRIADDGIGFNLDAPTRPAGLGLVSMTERVRLAGGTLSIRSRELVGTQIEATVPLRHKTNVTQLHKPQLTPDRIFKADVKTFFGRNTRIG